MASHIPDEPDRASRDEGERRAESTANWTVRTTRASISSAVTTRRLGWLSSSTALRVLVIHRLDGRYRYATAAARLPDIIRAIPASAPRAASDRPSGPDDVAASENSATAEENARASQASDRELSTWPGGSAKSFGSWSNVRSDASYGESGSGGSRRRETCSLFMVN